MYCHVQCYTDKGSESLSCYDQGLFVLTTPGQVVYSRDQDTPLPWAVFCFQLG